MIPSDWKSDDLKAFLDEAVAKYQTKDFIPLDPICVPHRYSLLQDIEIMGLFTAVFAWGQRPTIINKATHLAELMDKAPYDFIKNHTENDLKRISHFVHRTFNGTDTLYFIHFLHQHYQKYTSLEDAFWVKDLDRSEHIGPGLIAFHTYFFADENAPARTRKHIATPLSGSACKRLNMFLRWMVRIDPAGVDFGLWKKIKPSQLVCPCDLHVDRVGRSLGLITDQKTNWKTALELTENLKKFDPSDPVKYDFALFGLGVMEKY